MKSAALAVLASLLSAAYWWTVFTMVYADVLFAADRNPAAQPPSDHDVLSRAGIIIVVAVVMYAAAVALWQRLWRAGR